MIRRRLGYWKSLPLSILLGSRKHHGLSESCFARAEALLSCNCYASRCVFDGAGSSQGSSVGLRILEAVVDHSVAVTLCMVCAFCKSAIGVASFTVGAN